MTRRRGAALLELVVALPLLLLVAALAVQGFTAQLRVITAQEARLANMRELEHAALALAADLRPLSAWDLATWSDSAVVAQVPVLTGYVCGAPTPLLIDVAIGVVGAAARSVLHADPRAGDVIGWSDVDSAAVGLAISELDGQRVEAVVRDARPTASACTGSPIRGLASPWRITIAVPSTTPPIPGSPVTLSRRTEWRAYRASDAAYYLGRRDWNGMAWSTIQPVAGPLHSPAEGGLVLRVLRADGSNASTAVRDARLVDVMLRAPRGRAALSDTLRLRLALRGGGP